MAINKTGYSANQFLGIETYEPNIPSINRTDQDNPDFFFPGPTTPNVYDSPSIYRRGASAEEVSLRTPLGIQRGFIRGIFPDVIKKLKDTQNADSRYKDIEPPTRRCFFQFNPSLILRSVQASSTTLNPLLQSPTQLLQPIPGQASFEFQLLFNREREVSAQQYVKADGGRAATVPLTESLDAYGDTVVYSPTQLGDLGVLVDLYVLDSIIGQSITKDTVESIKAYWEASKNLRGTTELDSDGKPITDNPYKDEKFLGDSTFSSNLSQVLGNSAFLNPMPIRIVFSSLFMVEGFVTASNVAFHKFSRNMVPTVCQVTLSVQALYLGFAKKNSYVTEQLTKQVETDITNDEDNAENIAITKKLITDELFILVEKLYYSFEGNWNSGNTTRYASYLQNSSLNTWFNATYTYNKTAGTAPKLPFSLGTAREALVNSPNPFLEDGKNLKTGSSKVFKDKFTTDAQNTKIETLHFFFYDEAKMPAWAKDNNKLIDKAEKGLIVNGNYDGLKRQAKTRMWWMDSEDSAKTKKLIADHPSKYFEESKWGSTRAQAHASNYYLDDMEEHGFDEDNLKTPLSYFGTSTTILAIATIVSETKNANGGDPIKVSVKKAVSLSGFDPNGPALNTVQPFIF